MAGLGDIESAVGSLLGLGESVLDHLDDEKKTQAPRVILIPEEGDEYEFAILPEDALEPAGEGVYVAREAPGAKPIYQFMGPGEQRLGMHGVLKGAEAYTDYEMFERWKRDGVVFTLVYGPINKIVAVRDIRWRIRSLTEFWYDMELVEFDDVSSQFKAEVVVWPEWKAGGLLALLNDVLDSVNGFKGKMQNLISRITDVVDGVMAVTDMMNDIGGAFVDILEMPGDLAAYVRGAAAEVKEDLVETVDRFTELEETYGGGSKDPNRNAGPGGSGGSSDPVFSSPRAEDLKAKRAFGRARKALRGMRIELDILDRTLARVEQGADMNVPAHVVIDGETLRDVSVKYYGTADYWSAVARRNRLASFDLVAGQKLVIPKVEGEVETAFGIYSFDNFWDWFLERRRTWWKQSRRRHAQKYIGGYYQIGPDIASMVNLGFGTAGSFNERVPWAQDYNRDTVFGNTGDMA
ncbi:MAG: LysM peptidoglycan-binding domain-containing protein [Candidatus Zixiibacteriota bacterium]|jgi:hypothetical protein